MPPAAMRDNRCSNSDRSSARAGTRPAVLLLLAALLALGFVAGRSLWHRQSLSWQVNRGLALLSGVENASALRAALDAWESQTRPYWNDRRDELIGWLFRAYALEDWRIQVLLTRVSNANYGDRREDWERWYANYRRMQAGLPPETSRKESVNLTPRWSTPIGLTGWFSTILALDGQIYVASLGTAFNAESDFADGVVRVDGTTGAADMWFAPEHRGPRDAIGLAAGDDCLFVACYNGMLAALARDGGSVWERHVGDPIVGAPLATDVNRDGATDVVVITRGGNVVALSSRGEVLWRRTIATPRPGERLLGAALGSGDLIAGSDLEIVATLPTGQTRVLSSRTGALLWGCEMSAGSLAGPVCRGNAYEHLPTAYVGDNAAGIWSLQRSANKLEAVRWQALALRSEETLVGALRMLSNRERPIASEPAPWIIAAPTGEYGGRVGAVCALDAGGLRWRLPLGGAIWGTPAIADLNADGRSELLVAATEPDGAGGVLGTLTVVSSSGHMLHRLYFPGAALECAPVIADVDGDGDLDVLVADQSGYLHCFGTKTYGAVEWGLLGGDSHNTRNADNAYAFGQVPVGRQWSWRPP
jgi:outer membrane protein assembly factor BamB